MVTVAIPTVIIPAAPTPCTARAAMSAPSFGASPPASDAIAKRAVEKSRTFFRPRMSPRRPIAMKHEATAIMYADKTHCSSGTDTSRSRAMSGRARFNAKKSTWTAKNMIDKAISVGRRRRWSVAFPGCGIREPHGPGARSQDRPTEGAGLTNQPFAITVRCVPTT